ncbi:MULTISPECIES: MsnO8 family LLM class oxidoreductase [unclassified Solwaraspora]|uniref:MsnO8 family LLM class oxidoreductase n=1 Tax=unclassified Solwaraspora TaxID=2627926 RepID=UPI00259B968A|nr:MsnO8 family LLM class oxidoreductase [Solwaraspora sp. WMMA2056]WJK42047.1 MsnO8 family LLM class oxidoreductase [Solwaraspora sp. WMMA2056]
MNTREEEALGDIVLSVLDQVPVFRDGSPAEAVRDCVTLAHSVESHGYHRYWIAEHHGSAAHACAAPEVVAAAAAAVTSRIRVGSGGVLLPHYSPLKVAETFRVLTALHPGRIDLGFGRGLGGPPAFAELLNPYAIRTDEAFLQQIGGLLGFLGDGRTITRVSVTPEIPTPPIPWMLGSGKSSAQMAGMLGLPFCLAQFIAPAECPEALAVYREKFRPSAWLEQPQAMLALRVLCADSDAEAEELAACFWMSCTTGWRAQVQRTDEYRGGAPNLDDARRYQLTDEDRRLRESRPYLQIAGTPAVVGKEIRRLQTLYDVHEVMLTTNCPGLGARQRSYELLAEEFRLSVE